MPSRGGVLLSAAMLLAGIGQLLVMPPFEGFDEIAHYSSIREIADTHGIPIFGRSTIARFVAEYRTSGPMPYTSVVPFNRNGGWTYETFFQNADARDQYVMRYRTRAGVDQQYQPTAQLNWEAQHPPLYYALLAPLAIVADHAVSFIAQLFLLRLVSFLLACAGLLIGVYGSVEFFVKRGGAQHAVTAGALAYPFLVPMFFPEFGRIGNDSLCLLFVGIAWTLLLRAIDAPHNVRLSSGLGIVLGLGLLTKAFFLPIGTGVCAYLAFRAWAARTNRRLAAARGRQSAIVASVALLLGAWWYVYKFVAYRSIIGGAELITLDAQGGLLPNLRQKFAFGYFMRGLAALFASAYYTGSWSLTRLPELLYLPGVLLLLLIGFFCVRQLRRTPLDAPLWAPLWMAMPMVGGFMYFILARIALEGSGQNIAGWYLNVLAPPLAVLIALGLTSGLAVRWFRRLAAVLGVYAILFFVAGQWAQAALFSGCAVKPAATKYYVFSDGRLCLTEIGEMSTRLSIIGWPVIAAVCFIGSLACLLVGLKDLWVSSQVHARERTLDDQA